MTSTVTPRALRDDVANVCMLAAVNNPDPLDIAPVQAKTRKAYEGRALAIVRAAGEAGQLNLTATAEVRGRPYHC